MKRIILFTLLISEIVSAQQMEVRLYDSNAPGPEHWTWKEGINNKNSVKVMTVYLRKNKRFKNSGYDFLTYRSQQYNPKRYHF